MMGTNRLERRVRRVGSETMPRDIGFCSLLFFPFGAIRGGAAIAPYGPITFNSYLTPIIFDYLFYSPMVNYN